MIGPKIVTPMKEDWYFLHSKFIDERDGMIVEEGEECEYHRAWVGRCGKKAVQTDPNRCKEHAGKTCNVCGDTATEGCPAQVGLICGAPLCNKHGMMDCQNHSKTRRVP